MPLPVPATQHKKVLLRRRMSEHDVFYAFGYILTGILVTSAFSMGLQFVAYGAAYKCAAGDQLCSVGKEAATRSKLMLQLALGVGDGDFAKGVRGNFQVVVLIAILLVLLGQWRTDAEKTRSKPTVAPPCVILLARCCLPGSSRAT